MNLLSKKIGSEAINPNMDDLLNPETGEKRSPHNHTPLPLKMEFSPKKLVYGALGTVAIAASIVLSPSSASAYQKHEHPFYNTRLNNISQAQADTYCRQIAWAKFRQQPIFRAYDGVWLRSGSVWSIWGHRNNGQCIANQ
jgi:hypothetical protein